MLHPSSHTKITKTCGRAGLSESALSPPPNWHVWGTVVNMKKRQPLVSSDSAHDPWLSVTFRSLVPLGRSFPAGLRSAPGHICLAPLAIWLYKHLAFEQSNEYGVSVPFRVRLYVFFFFSNFTLKDTKLNLLQLVVKRNSRYSILEDYYRH